MIRLKKKAVVEERKDDENMEVDANDSTKNTENKETTPAEEPKKVRILGIGRSKKGSQKKKEKKKTPGEIRIQKDIAELDGGNVATVDFPSPNDLTLFNVHVCADTGLWKGATYHFSFKIPPMYPHDPPKVLCHTKIYHPNIDLDGNVCLNILREDWKPVLDINAVIYGLIYLFYEPNPDDPLNREAAELYRNDFKQFERLVVQSLKGNYVQGIKFERLI